MGWALVAYRRIFNFGSGVGPLNQRQESDKQLSCTSRKIVDFDLALHVGLAWQPVEQLPHIL